MQQQKKTLMKKEKYLISKIEFYEKKINKKIKENKIMKF
jgi:hypothetical protein